MQRYAIRNEEKSTRYNALTELRKSVMTLALNICVKENYLVPV